MPSTETRELVTGDREFLLELSRRLDSQYSDLRDEIREIKSILFADLHEIKLKQVIHDKNWATVRTTLSWVIAPLSSVGLLAWAAEKLNLLPKQ